MRPTSTFTLFAAALSLYLAPFAAAEADAADHAVRSLNEQNLFEAHLHAHAETSHKRLPSEVLQHRDEQEQSHPSTEIVSASSPAATSEATTTPASGSTPKRNIPFSARQPSHFIKHTRKSAKLGKRRLSETATHYKRDSDDLEAVWTLPAVVSQAFVSKEGESSTESSEADDAETVSTVVRTDASSAKLAQLEHSTLAALQALNARLLPKANTPQQS